MKTRIAIVVSHPIQHFAPLYRQLALQPDIELKVFFCSRLGLDAYVDPGFGVEFRWETNLLEGYESEFLDSASRLKSLNFWDAYSADLPARLDHFKPDVVQVYGYAHRIALQALLWCGLHRVPALLMSDSELVHSRPLPVRVAKRLVLPAIYRAVTGFLTIGDNNELYLRHYGVDRQQMFRSPYPTDDALFLATRSKLAEVRRARRKALGIDESAFVSVFVGKLIDRKRPADLIAATRLSAKRTGLPMIALFVGDGALRDSLEAQVAAEAAGESVRFAGFINQTDLPSMYAAADVVAHPADNDPHPIAVTEGVLMGLPVVVSDRIGSVGPTDTVRPQQNGYVFPTGDVSAFAAALGELATDPLLRQRMGEASRRIAAEMGMDASVQGYLRAVRAAVEQRPRAKRGLREPQQDVSESAV
ncbi:MAG: hypothetical protein JWN04_5808 [Myxococcaceae bacterium]|nr:hypothetical protein [Myxococcaceae bacterium]